MNVGFYLTAGDPDGYILAGSLMRSVRRVMPSVPCVQLTDETSPIVPDADGVIRVPAAPLSGHRPALFASVYDGDWLFLDTDVVVHRDVRDVFEDRTFDVAVTDRLWAPLPSGRSRAGGEPHYVAKFPYNAGVIFSRSRPFWQDVRAHVGTSAKLTASFTGDQAALALLVQSDRYRIRVLSGQTYNFPPFGPNDPDLQTAAISHWKGKRRAALLEQSLAGSLA